MSVQGGKCLVQVARLVPVLEPGGELVLAWARKEATCLVAIHHSDLGACLTCNNCGFLPAVEVGAPM